MDGATSGSQDGLSWATAKKTIQEAVDAASGGDQIWVAQGLYNEYVVLKSGLSLYGGFAKTEVSVDERDWTAYKTILDGTGGTELETLLIKDITDVVVDGFQTQNTSNAVYADSDGGTVLLRNCRFAKSDYAAVCFEGNWGDIQDCSFAMNNTKNGAAAFSGIAMPHCHIHNCVFEYNVSHSSDGTIYIGNCKDAEISFCTIRNNTALSGDGGAICADGSVTIKDCVITGNSAGKGGGVYGGTVINCLIANNHADYGGGVYGGDVKNSIIANNTAGHGGGVCGNVYQRITNCTIIGNVATAGGMYGDPGGGGVYCFTDIFNPPPPWPPERIPGHLYATNTIFANNSPNAIGYDYDSFVYPNNDLFYQNPYAAQTQGENFPTGADLNVSLPQLSGWGNLDGDPAFVNPAAGDYHLKPNSAAIDRGTNVALTADYDGAPRPVDIPGVGYDGPGAFDIGAYEYQFVAPPVSPSLSGAADAGGGEVGLTWTDDNGTTPAQYLAFAHDVYAAQFVPRGAGGTMWYPFLPPARSGPMDVAQTGAYFAWISDQWWDGTWLACLNPATLIVYSGSPHEPTGLSVEDRGGGVWRLHWNPEIYGTWLDQIAIYQNDVGWIAPLDGPTSAFPQFSPWTFLDYGGLAYDSSKGDFFAGWADFALPAGGSYVFFLNFKAWDAATDGPFAMAATQ
ncbi:MAG: right-handed parallel beta-helix repeat-containing protein [Candidatus Sumerlaeota bacterium]|nr:right-handed parallel beta-helix repeat-containing protein [Candidatus Sumerlaeota bacterium]